ncbi:hypothetical protein [Xanthomonas sp. WHRI 7945]|nr:hypothetical protein [Xanthomonas campestris pv. campestris]
MGSSANNGEAACPGWRVGMRLGFRFGGVVHGTFSFAFRRWDSWKKGNKKAPSGCLSARIGGGGALRLGAVHPIRQAHPACAGAQGVGRQYQQRCVRHGRAGDTADEGASLDLRRRRVNAFGATPLEHSGAARATTRLPLASVVVARATHGRQLRWRRPSIRNGSMSMSFPALVGQRAHVAVALVARMREHRAAAGMGDSRKGKSFRLLASLLGRK